MKYIFALFFILWLSYKLTFSGDDKPKEVRPTTLAIPTLEGKPEAVAVVKSNWQKLLSHCPGLVKYQVDMSFVQLRDMLNLWDIPGNAEMERAAVIFKIADDPKLIPNRYQAWGHTCGYGISPAGDTLRIKKDACVSVCLDERYTGTGSDYFTRL